MGCRVRVEVECPGYLGRTREWSRCRNGRDLDWVCRLDPALSIGGLFLTPAGPLLLPR